MIGYLGSGRTRHVFRVGPWAIKVPRLTNLREAMDASRREESLWRRSHSPLLCPVLLRIGPVIVMPIREVRVGIPRPSQLSAMIALMGQDDLCAVNVGWLGSVPQAIDYGRSRYPGEPTVGREPSRTEGGQSAIGDGGWVD